MKFLNSKLLLLSIILCFSFIGINNLTLSNILAESGIAIVESDRIKPYDLAIEGFQDTCKGEIYKKYNLLSDLSKGKDIIKDIKNAKPNLVLAIGAKAGYLLSKGIKDIPIVFCMVADPEKSGVEGDNVTGVILNVPVEVQLKRFKEVFPKLKNIGVVYSSQDVEALISEADVVAKNMGININSVKVADMKEIPDALDSLLPQVDLVWLLYDPLVTSSKRIITDWILLPALKMKVPVVGFNKWCVTEGAFLCFYIDYKGIGRQAGRIANKILKGQIPQAIKISYPETINILINYSTLRRIKEEDKAIKIPKDAYVYGQD